jgi:hypothetical protein
MKPKPLLCACCQLPANQMIAIGLEAPICYACHETRGQTRQWKRGGSRLAQPVWDMSILAENYQRK